MQSAEAVVEVLRARGRRGLPCERLYRQLFNPALFLMAWGRIYANDGAMTPGGQRGNRGRHVTGQDRADHRCAAPRALPVPASQTGLHPEEERQEKAARPAVMVR